MSSAHDLITTEVDDGAAPMITGTQPAVNDDLDAGDRPAVDGDFGAGDRPAVDDDFGGDTLAFYLPNEPRRPGPPTLPPPFSLQISSHGSPSIAELFQDMLRRAFTGGVAAAASGETFETWYHREVLR